MSDRLPMLGAARPVKSIEKLPKTALRGAVKAIEGAEAEMLLDVARALDDAGISQDAAATFMGITAPQLNRQLKGSWSEHLSVRRLGLLPREFQQAFNKRRCRRVQQHCQSQEKRTERINQVTASLLMLLEESA